MARKVISETYATGLLENILPILLMIGKMI